MEHTIIIPSLNPDIKLITLADELIKMGAGGIVIVNDGSDAKYAHIYDHLKHYENIKIIDHAVNLGKGAALKTAFTYCMEHYSDIKGIITADCDGQHTSKDIFRVSEAMSQDPDCIILGVRIFTKASTPFRSFIGNMTTNRIFNFLYNVDLSDTQTGLRGIPASELEWVSKVKGQRYEYELNMLIQAKRKYVKIKQIPVDILYFDNNQGSHYRTLKDSLLIIKALLNNLFSDLQKDKPFYGKLFYFCRRILRVFFKKFTVIGEIPPKPVILVGHHQNLKGVIRIMMWLNIDARIWMLWVFCNKEECFSQYYNYTFTRRFGWNKIYAYLAAYVSSRFVPKLAQSMRAVPVYRKSVKDLNITINNSVEALCNKENLLIFPDIDYASDSNSMGEIYMGFISIDKFYYKKTGRHVDFIPIRTDMERKLIIFGRPSSVKEDETYAEAKKRIGLELKRELNL